MKISGFTSTMKFVDDLKAGNYDDYPVGTEVTLLMKGTSPTKFAVIAKNTDVDSDNNKIPLTLIQCNNLNHYSFIYSNLLNNFQQIYDMISIPALKNRIVPSKRCIVQSGYNGVVVTTNYYKTVIPSLKETNTYYTSQGSQWPDNVNRDTSFIYTYYASIISKYYNTNQTIIGLRNYFSTTSTPTHMWTAKINTRNSLSSTTGAVYAPILFCVK